MGQLLGLSDEIVWLCVVGGGGMASLYPTSTRCEETGRKRTAFSNKLAGEPSRGSERGWRELGGFVHAEGGRGWHVVLKKEKEEEEASLLRSRSLSSSSLRTLPSEHSTTWKPLRVTDVMACREHDRPRTKHKTEPTRPPASQQVSKPSTCCTLSSESNPDDNASSRQTQPTSHARPPIRPPNRSSIQQCLSLLETQFTRFTTNGHAALLLLMSVPRASRVAVPACWQGSWARSLPSGRRVLAQRYDNDDDDHNDNDNDADQDETRDETSRWLCKALLLAFSDCILSACLRLCSGLCRGLVGLPNAAAASGLSEADAMAQLIGLPEHFVCSDAETDKDGRRTSDVGRRRHEQANKEDALHTAGQSAVPPSHPRQTNRDEEYDGKSAINLANMHSCFVYPLDADVKKNLHGSETFILPGISSSIFASSVYVL
ncbi:hypothetical protein BKA81DRAFT_378113 [Phyllosticta paracitricarpa]